MKYTAKQKKEYYVGLRAEWNAAKKALTENMISEIDAIVATHGLNISATSFFIVASAMKVQGLEGIPYLDAKTYKGWKEAGFQVKKGEHSTLGSITWIGVEGKEAKPGEDAKDSFVMPKAYKLFHRSQVEEIAA